MNAHSQWLFDLDTTPGAHSVDGLIRVEGFAAAHFAPEEVAIMEKAKMYGAHAVFFEASRNGRPAAPQAFVFISDGPANDTEFGQLHRRLWSWGGVPLLYRKTPGLVQLFRCAHKADFISPNGQIICNPVKTLKLVAAISSTEQTAHEEPWWDAGSLRNGTLWDNPDVSHAMLCATKAAHKRLVEAVEGLYQELNKHNILREHLRRRLLILSLLIAYLEQRGAFPQDYFCRFASDSTRFFEVLKDGKALVALLKDLERRFNGNVFTLPKADHALLADSNAGLRRFSKLVEAHEDESGQRNFWQIYSFRDLPVELISHIYQLFVSDSDTAIYTPIFLARMMLEEALSWERLDALETRNEIILDPSCGSGVFLVEAYKRLILHWRSRHEWKRPRVRELKRLLERVHGIDMEEGAVELAAFSLCLALCDALEPEEIRASIRLFPPLAGNTIHRGCFFDIKERRAIKGPIGIIVGNPPFESSLTTPGAQNSYHRYNAEHGALPDKQVGYLFLHEAMDLLGSGGLLCMLQQYNFLYNQKSLEFRRHFIHLWDVRQVLDLTSVRGLFRGAADTKVIVVVALRSPPDPTGRILHAVFRRTGRVDSEQGFDIDYYDLHRVPRDLALKNDRIWRANLLGGGRVLTFLDRLNTFRTLKDYAEQRNWDFGEGFIEGRRQVSGAADHIIGKRHLPSDALTEEGIDPSRIIARFPRKPIEGPRTRRRFTAPMLLIREQMDLPHVVWHDGYMTFKNKIVGFAAPSSDQKRLATIDRWLSNHSTALRAYAAGISLRLFTQKGTTLSAADILGLPYPEDGSLDLSENEHIIADDIVRFQRDLVRLGEAAAAMKEANRTALSAFTEVFVDHINGVFRGKPLRPLKEHSWPGLICQPFVMGEGELDWHGSDELRNKLDTLLRQKHGTALQVTRIARIYEGRFIFLLKPNRLRYWLRSIALRDADEMLADLRNQGI